MSPNKSAAAKKSDSEVADTPEIMSPPPPLEKTPDPPVNEKQSRQELRKEREKSRIQIEEKKQKQQQKKGSTRPTDNRFIVEKSTWMSSFHEFPLLSLTLPGSHNAACYDFPGFSFITSNAKCQTFSILKQLLIGVRYLDIRIRQVEENFWVGHSFMSKISLSEVLWQVKCFMDAHPSEVIVFELDYEHHPVGKGGNTIDWKRVALLMNKVFHDSSWKQMNLDQVVHVDQNMHEEEGLHVPMSTERKKKSHHHIPGHHHHHHHKSEENDETVGLSPTNFVKEFEHIKKKVSKYLRHRRSHSRVKDQALLDQVYGDDRHQFELWWLYNCYRTKVLKEHRQKRKQDDASPPEASSSTDSSSPKDVPAPASAAEESDADLSQDDFAIDLNTFLTLSVPWEDRNKPIGHWVKQKRNLVVLNDHFKPVNSWPRSFRIKSWQHTRTPHISEVKGLWNEFISKHQEGILDEEQEVWTHLNCVLTMNMKAYFSKVLGRGGFEAYCRACNRALIDLLKHEKEEDKKFHFHDHIRMQIVDCDYIGEEICQLLIQRNFRLLLGMDSKHVSVPAKSEIVETPQEDVKSEAELDEMIEEVVEKSKQEPESKADEYKLHKLLQELDEESSDSEAQ